jgi:GT2 family glycosyltransferase
VISKLRKQFGASRALSSLKMFTGGPLSLGDKLLFDEARYLELNRDVRVALDRGELSGGLEHYAQRGIWEGRPFAETGRAWWKYLPVALSRLEQGVRIAGTRLSRGSVLRVTPGRGVVAVPDHAVPRAARGELMRAEARDGEVVADASFDPGWYLVTLWLESGLRKAFTRLELDDESGQMLGVFGLAHRADKAVRRLVCIEGGRATRIRLIPLGCRGLFRVRTLRLRRVSDGFASSRMLRRIAHHTPEHLAREPAAIWEALKAAARNDVPESSDEDVRTRAWERMREQYEATFVSPTLNIDYAGWQRNFETSRARMLDNGLDGRLARLEHRPKFSVLVPVYETGEAHLRACLESVLGQSYPDWELCVVDDASRAAHVRRVLEEYGARDSRVKIKFRDRNGHISMASNDALEMAKGDYVALLDHDDVLARHALLEMALALDRQPQAVVVYSDEDKLGAAGDRHSPHFKPDFDPDRLCEQCYIGHLGVARTARVREVGGFRQGYEGSQDHDLWLRLTDGVAASAVLHVPWVLYHWRETEGSTAASAEAKPYTEVAGLRAVMDALRRREVPASAEHHPLIPNSYRIHWSVPDPAPLVSIIVPTRDALHVLQACVVGVLQRTKYPRFELLIVDNDSQERATHEFFDRIVRRDPRVRVLPYPGPFNFSAINNFAVDRAQGEIIALVNNDVEPIEPGWLAEMVGHACRPEIGCVGAKLLYPDGRIQHAGVVMGVGGIAGHAHKFLPAQDGGYFGRPHVTHTVSAVTAACLVVRKALYQEVGGMDADRLPVAFNDVDLCLKVQSTGRRNLFTPYALLYHHESATRASDHDASNIERFNSEIETMKERWLAHSMVDPYYNPQLTLTRADFGFREPR